MSEINTPSSESIDIVDMFLDEFSRIKAILANGLTDHTAMEINRLCERAQKQIKQRVPLIEQRDRLERELIQAQQRESDLLETIAQKDGEIRNLREALKPFAMMYREEATCGLDYVVATRGYASDMTMITEADIHKAAHSLSTPAPVAVVPWVVVEEYATALRDILKQYHDKKPRTTKQDAAFEAATLKLQSYAPKGNQ